MKYKYLIISLVFIVSCVSAKGIILQTYDSFIIHFIPGTLELKNDNTLYENINRVVSNSNVIHIEGYSCPEDTSKNPDDTYLLKIAKKRALVIKQKLLELGTLSSNIYTIAYGVSTEENDCKVRIVIKQRKLK